MISSKKKSAKRIWSGIIISVFFAVITLFILTKLIYDGTFTRYDVIPEVPSALNQTVEKRKEVSFLCGENKLQGYLYQGEGNGLIVFVPGYRASADDYLWQIQEFLNCGWGVFSFDTTGSCRSEGDSSVGFPQVSLDLDAALEYIEKNDRFGYEKIFLVGHSRGGYAVCSALDGEHDIAAAVTVSGVNSCMDAIMQPVADKIGFLAYGNYPTLWLYQSLMFGADTVSTEAHTEINESNLPVLVIQGTEDTKYTEKKYSVYSHSIDNQSDNVEYYLYDAPGQNGHTSLLFDADGSANDKVISEIDLFFKRNN